jgi:hypothetical protein
MSDTFPDHLRRWSGEPYREQAVSSAGAASFVSWQKFKMRVLLAIALLIFFGNFGVIAANSTSDQCVIAHNYRRALPPLKHYFPTTGVKPKAGRSEDLSEMSGAPEPQKTYRRNY